MLLDHAALLLGDIGGTTARFAWLTQSGVGPVEHVPGDLGQLLRIGRLVLHNATLGRSTGAGKDRIDGRAGPSASRGDARRQLSVGCDAAARGSHNCGQGRVFDGHRLAGDRAWWPPTRRVPGPLIGGGSYRKNRVIRWESPSHLRSPRALPDARVT